MLYVLNIKFMVPNKSTVVHWIRSRGSSKDAPYSFLLPLKKSCHFHVLHKCTFPVLPLTLGLVVVVPHFSGPTQQSLSTPYPFTSQDPTSAALLVKNELLQIYSEKTFHPIFLFQLPLCSLSNLNVIESNRVFNYPCNFHKDQHCDTVLISGTY